MKKITQPANKLQFKKQAIANLTRTDLANVNGGQAAVTTSFGKCTGFLCCSPTKTRDIIDDWLDTLTTAPQNPQNPQPQDPSLIG